MVPARPRQALDKALSHWIRDIDKDDQQYTRSLLQGGKRGAALVNEQIRFQIYRSDSVAHLDPVTNADVRRQMADLDQLFPRIPSETGDPPRQKQTFTEWLPRVRRQPRRRVDNSEGT